MLGDLRFVNDVWQVLEVAAGRAKAAPILLQFPSVRVAVIFFVYSIGFDIYLRGAYVDRRRGPAGDLVRVILTSDAPAEAVKKASLLCIFW